MEFTVWLTPEEAAVGAVKTIVLPGGPISVRVPPVGDGAVINVPTGGVVVPVRARVGYAPPGVPYQDPGIPVARPAPTARRPWYRTPVAWAGASLAAVVAVVVGVAFTISQSSAGIPPGCGCAVYSPSPITNPSGSGIPASPSAAPSDLAPSPLSSASTSSNSAAGGT